MGIAKVRAIVEECRLQQPLMLWCIAWAQQEAAGKGVQHFEIGTPAASAAAGSSAAPQRLAALAPGPARRVRRSRVLPQRLGAVDRRQAVG